MGKKTLRESSKSLKWAPKHLEKRFHFRTHIAISWVPPGRLCGAILAPTWSRVCGPRAHQKRLKNDTKHIPKLIQIEWNIDERIWSPKGGAAPCFKVSRSCPYYFIRLEFVLKWQAIETTWTRNEISAEESEALEGGATPPSRSWKLFIHISFEFR